jgi:hypothetical protein
MIKYIKTKLSLFLAIILITTPVNSFGSDNNLLKNEFSKIINDSTRAQWGTIALNLGKTHKNYTGKNIIVAVLDTGVDGTHPDLKGNLVDGYSTITNEIISKDVNSDYQGHGTHVAGIIAAKKNDIGITGISPDAKIMPIKVLGANGGSDLTVASGIKYAVENGANVINLSLGGERNLFEKNDNLTCIEINNAINKNIPVIVASGNQGSYLNPLNLPAGCEGSISVAAIDKKLNKSYFSSFDSSIFIAAPGVDIISTIPFNDNYNYDYMSGTSMAAPHISGAVALLLEQNPNISYTKLKDKLSKSTLDIDIQGKDPNTGYGLLDINKLLYNESTSIKIIKANLAKSSSATITKAISNTKKTDIMISYNTKDKILSEEIIYQFNGKITSFKVKNNEKRVTIPIDAWKGGYIVLAIKYKDRLYFSDNFYVTDIKFPESKTPVFVANISNITTSWNDKGIEVTFENKGGDGQLDYTLLDWNYSLYTDKKISTNDSKFIIPVDEISELRAHYNVLLIGTPGNLQTHYVTPQYYLYAQLLEIDKEDHVIKGTTVNLCFQERLACGGDDVEIINYATGEPIAKTTILDDLSFSIILNNNMLSEKMVIKHKNTISNILNYNKGR